MYIRIDDRVFEVDSTEQREGAYKIVTKGREEFLIFKSLEEAGKSAREYWREMAEHDPDVFVFMVGANVLLRWALGQYAGPGGIQVESLSEWLDLWLDTPEEHFASYDGEERKVTSFSRKLLAEVEDDDAWMTAVRNEEAVAYRTI